MQTSLAPIPGNIRKSCCWMSERGDSRSRWSRDLEAALSATASFFCAYGIMLMLVMNAHQNQD